MKSVLLCFYIYCTNFIHDMNAMLMLCFDVSLHVILYHEFMKERIILMSFLVKERNGASTKNSTG